jgi:hypothetical protein
MIEPWDQNSQFPGAESVLPISCNAAMGFGNGQGFTATMTSFATGSASCQYGMAESLTVGSWTWTQDMYPLVEGDGVLQDSYITTHGSCGAKLWIDVGTATLPSGTPQPGQMPTATVMFSFQSGYDPTCPRLCAGKMVATVEKL